MTDREELEQLASKTISSELYWELQDSMDSITDAELRELIDCGGDYQKELELQEYYESAEYINQAYGGK